MVPQVYAGVLHPPPSQPLLLGHPQGPAIHFNSSVPPLTCPTSQVRRSGRLRTSTKLTAKQPPRVTQSTTMPWTTG